MAKSAYVLRTQHLRLRALSVEECYFAYTQDRLALGRSIRALVPAEWPGPDLRDSLPVIISQMRELGGDERWVWVVIEKKSRAVVGDIGFHSPVVETPSPELGYLILPGSQGNGYATEASQALLAWAAKRPGVQRVIVRISPTNNPSLKVAEKLGMREIDPEIEGGQTKYRRFEWQASG